jgi:hypothetical protein
MKLTRRSAVAASALVFCAPLASAGQQQAEGSSANSGSEARYKLHVTPQGWVLDLVVSGECHERAMTQNFGNVTAFSKAEHRRALARYMRENARLYFDGKRVHLTTIATKLGDYESQIRCPLPTPRAAPQKIRMELKAFSEVNSGATPVAVEIPGGEASRAEGSITASTRYVVEWVRGTGFTHVKVRPAPSEAGKDDDASRDGATIQEASLDDVAAAASAQAKDGAPKSGVGRGHGPSFGDFIPAALVGAVGAWMTFKKK